MNERKIETVFQLKNWFEATYTRIQTLKVTFSLTDEAFREEVEQLYQICNQMADAMDQLEIQGQSLGGLETHYVDLLIEISQAEAQRKRYSVDTHSQRYA